jgi:hypothetical protein
MWKFLDHTELKTHTHTHTVGLLRSRDQLLAGPLNAQHTQNKRNERPALRGIIPLILGIKGQQNYVLDCKVPTISRLPPTPVTNINTLRTGDADLRF